MESRDSATRTATFASPMGKAVEVLPDFELPPRWKLARALGRGGQASVWLAHDEQLDDWVAVKVLVGPLDPVRMERLRREVNLGRTLAHSNLLRVYELMDLGDNLAIVMEWVEGGSLGERLEAGPDGISLEPVQLPVRIDRDGNPIGGTLEGAGWSARRAFWYDLGTSSYDLASGQSQPDGMLAFFGRHPEVLSEEPMKVAAFFMLARSLAVSAQLDRAIDLLEKAAAEHPGYRDLALRLGEYALMAGRSTLGRSTLEPAGRWQYEKHVWVPLAHDVVAVAAEAAGDRERARVHRSEATRLAPNCWFGKGERSR